MECEAEERGGGGALMRTLDAADEDDWSDESNGGAEAGI